MRNPFVKKQFQMNDEIFARTAAQNVMKQVGSALARGVKQHKIDRIVAGFGLSMTAISAFAAPPDFTTLTTGVDFSTVGPALLLIAVAISGVYVIWKGAKMILSAVKSA